MKTVNTLLAEIGDVRTNPAAIQRVMLSALETMVDGQYDVVDPSNPFVFLMEAGSVVGAAGIQRSETLIRQQYPSLAQDEGDLYHHMNDADYIDRFATPAHTNITFLLSLDEIKSRAIDDGSGVKKMVIPRDSEITVEDMTFTMQYPIEIRIMPHGGVNIVYDVSVLSPLQILNSNLIDWDAIKLSAAMDDMSGITMLKFDIPIYQFKLTDYYDQLSASSGFTKTYDFTDDFYYCRVYISDEANEWDEITTTYSEKVYDPTTPTASLKVVGKSLVVDIPQVYFTNNLLSRGIRIDIYTTKGVLDTALERYQPTNFMANWRDLAKFKNDYLTPIRSFSTLLVFSTSQVTGGRNQLDFDTLRSRVMNNALGSINVPITSAQLVAEMDTFGYTIVKEIDNITNRMYLATRELPKPENDLFGTGIGTTITTLETTINSLKMIATVKDNGARITIESGTLMRSDLGKLTLVDNAMLDTLANSSPEVRVQYLISNPFTYTPFHYVLDTNDNTFNAKAYFLDTPVIDSKQFIAENQTTQLGISTADFAIEKVASGYEIVVKTHSGDAVKALADDQLHAQLSFTPIGEISRTHLNGVLLGRDENGELIFKFSLACNFDIDANDGLQFDTFQMYEGETKSFGIELQATIDISYAVSNYSATDMEYGIIDAVLGSFLLPATAIGVAQEQLNVNFGTALTGLWSASKTIAGPADYETWISDEPAVYTEIVYVRDPITNIIEMTLTDDVPPNVVYTVLHAAGDPVLDIDSNPTYEHLAGDTKLDANGNPIELSPRNILRQVDILLLEGAFLYVTETSVKTYVEDIISGLVSWIDNDIKSISERLLENTRMWYYPSTTLGNVEAYVESGILISIPSEQSLTIKFYMTDLAYGNLALREDLTNTAISILSAAFSNKTISMSAIATKIKLQVGDDIIDVSAFGLGGVSNYEVLTLRYDSSRLNIRKLPIVLPDGRITLQDDVTIEFINHL